MFDTDSSITIAFKSDWHIGSGTGRPGDVDRLIRRDCYRTPFVPGKTITGILRDACERVAHALDSDRQEGQHTWTDWVTFLFGSHREGEEFVPPAPAHIQIDSAHMPQALREAIANKPALQSALTFVKPGVKIDSVSGTAEDKHFRLVEMARGGIDLKAPFKIEGLDDATELQKNAAKALLAAGAAVVERIGSKRRRGAGRCTLSIGEREDDRAATILEQALGVLEKETSPPAPPTPHQETEAGVYDSNQGDSSTWIAIPITLETQQPVIISKGTVGNVVQSLDYIPGTHLLPIVAKHLGSMGINVREAIAKSHLIITNAHPSIGDRATAPTPFAWFYEKQSATLSRPLNGSDRQRTYLNATNKLWGELNDGKQRKQFRGGYITPDFIKEAPKAVKRVEVSLGIETHNTVDDRKQRPTSDVGGVYSYQAIPVGTTLQAELRLHPSLCAQLNAIEGQKNQWFAKLHNQTHSVGVSRKDEYGNLRLQIGKPVQHDVNKKGSDRPQNAEVVVWLTSDLLLRNQWLQPTSRVEDLLQALTEELQLPVGSLTELPFQTGGSGDSKKKPPAPILARQGRNESWQTRWGLPRPTLAGLTAGSCFRIQLASGVSISAEACRQLEMAGLGERRVEGYGQLRIDPAILRKEAVEVFELASESEPKGDCSSTEVTGKTNEYLQRIEEAAWREAIYRAATTLASQSSIRKQHLKFQISKEGRSTPTLTQLGGLRAQLMASVASGNETSACSWLNSQIEKKAGAETAFKRVKQILESKDEDAEIWKVLNFEDTLKLGVEDLCRDTKRSGELKQSLRLEAIEVFVSECIRAQSRECEPKEEASVQPKETTGAGV